MKKPNKSTWLKTLEKRNKAFDSMKPIEQIAYLEKFILQGHPESDKIKEQIISIKVVKNVRMEPCFFIEEKKIVKVNNINRKEAHND